MPHFYTPFGPKATSAPDALDSVPKPHPDLSGTFIPKLRAAGFDDDAIRS